MFNRNRKKILFIGHLPPPSTGESNVLLTYFQTLPQKGYEPQLFNTGIRSHKYRASSFNFYNLLRAVRQFISFFLECLTSRPKYINLMFTSGTLPIFKFYVFCLIGHLLGSKVIAQHHAGEIQTKWNQLGKMSQRFAIHSLKLPDAWVAPEEVWRDFLIERGVSSENITIIPNAIKQEIISLLNKSHDMDTDNSKHLKILFVGTLTKRKGLDVLFTAINNLSIDSQSFELIIVGGEGQPGEKDSIISKFRDSPFTKNCKILSPIEGSHYLNLLFSCDIFVLPSYAENLPISLLEAMASGMAVIATSVGAIPTLLGNNERGLLIPIGDAKSLTDALYQLLNSSSLRQILSEKAKKYIQENHLPEKSAEKFIHLIERLK